MAAKVDGNGSQETWRLIEKSHILDNKQDFVEVVNSLPCDVLENELDSMNMSMFLHDSCNCAAAVLDGETRIPNVTTWLPMESGTPLHRAALHGAHRITALLLQRGFPADLRCDSHFRISLKHVLPLEAGLSQMHFQLSRYLRGRPSAVKLIVHLCGHMGLRNRLETLRLLAQNTREVKSVFFNYLKEEKMNDVGPLLLIARSRLLSSSTAQGEFCSISEIRDFILDANPRLSSGASIAEKNEMLVLLDILDRVGDQLAALIRLDLTESNPCLAVASLLADAGFDGKTEDTYAIHTFSRSLWTVYQPYVSETGFDACKKTALVPTVWPSVGKRSCVECFG